MAELYKKNREAMGCEGRESKREREKEREEIAKRCRPLVQMLIEGGGTSTRRGDNREGRESVNLGG